VGRAPRTPVVDNGPMPDVHLRYWAGAKAAAGTDAETYAADTVREALNRAREARGEHFARVLGACSLLVDGLSTRGDDLDRSLVDAVEVEVLPPFAGGSSGSPPVVTTARGPVRKVTLG
jgi:molybdopterin synthase sulfur carrier subunit